MMFETVNTPRSQAGLAGSFLLHTGTVVMISAGFLAFAPAAAAVPAPTTRTIMVFVQPLPDANFLVEPLVTVAKTLKVVVPRPPKVTVPRVATPVVEPLPVPAAAAPAVVVPVVQAVPIPAAPAVALLAASTLTLGRPINDSGFGTLQGRASLFEPVMLTATALHVPYGRLTDGGFSATRGREEWFEPVRTPYHILSVPSPGYTDAALALKIQGEVWVEVELTALGRVRVFRVAQGLGHGLDELAVGAVEQMEFQPATRNDISVDFRTVIRVKFSFIN